MRLAVVLVGLILCNPASLIGAEARILKVLPHLLDEEGRHALAPSLYERDAYQALLRKQPQRIGGLRFDVHWKAIGTSSGPLKLRIEMRTANRPDAPPLLLEVPVKKGAFGKRWSSLVLDKESYRASGSVLAWKATLLDGDTALASKQSFLW